MHSIQDYKALAASSEWKLHWSGIWEICFQMALFKLWDPNETKNSRRINSLAQLIDKKIAESINFEMFWNLTYYANVIKQRNIVWWKRCFLDQMYLYALCYFIYSIYSKSSIKVYLLNIKSLHYMIHISQTSDIWAFCYLFVTWSWDPDKYLSLLKLYLPKIFFLTKSLVYIINVYIDYLNLSIFSNLRWLKSIT